MRARFFLLPLIVSSLTAGELQDAARLGESEKVRRQLASGVNINSTGERGRTALHEAVAAGKLEIVELLLSKGANRNLYDNDHRTPLSLAYMLADRVLAARIGATLLAGVPVALPKDSEPWTLQMAAARSQVSVIEMLAKLGADVNAAGPNGNRPLNIACLKGDLKAVQTLVDHGADVNARSSAGVAPLHEAALNGSVPVGELLLSRGANIDAVDEDSGSTALYYAVSFDRSDFAKLLIAKGAAVNMRTKSGRTPLAAAKEMQLTELETLLRKAGATD